MHRVTANATFTVVISAVMVFWPWYVAKFVARWQIADWWFILAGAVIAGLLLLPVANAGDRSANDRLDQQSVPAHRVWMSTCILTGIFVILPLLFAARFIPALVPGTSEFSDRVVREDQAKMARGVVQAPDNRPAAVAACRGAVRSTVRFPSKAEFDPGWFGSLDIVRLRGEASVFIVRGRVDLMNGLGNMIPHTYACEVDGVIVRKILTEPG